MKISMDKKYYNGIGPVRIICTDAPGEQPIVGIDSDGDVGRWDADGTYISGCKGGNDLIEYHEPDIRTIWVNVHDRGCGLVAVAFNSEEESREYVDSDTLVVAKSLTFEVKRER